MFANPDFPGFERGGSQRFPKPTIESVPAEAPGQDAGMTPIYAAAWNLARRDVELDRLFNPDFYRGRDI